MDTTDLNQDGTTRNTSESSNNHTPDSSQDSTSTQLFLPSTNQTIGKSKVLDYIASGGIATVYKVFHEDLEVIRAVKLLKPGYTEETRKRFKTEAKISAHLHHPNIVHIYNVGSWQNKFPYIEMEYVDGTSLCEILEKHSKLPPAFVIAVSYIVCAALEYAQKQDFTVYGTTYHGLVHRDIKPANILISKQGVVKLADFGIALPGSVSLHTEGPYTMGTYAYLSPEQLSGEPLDFRCDIYALGAVMYEMLTGQKAYPQKSVADLVQNKMNGSYVPVQTLAPETPDALGAIVEKCMSNQPSCRHESTTELLRELKETLRTITASSPASLVTSYLENPRKSFSPPKTHHKHRSPDEKPSRRKTVLFGSVLAVVLLASAAVIQLRFGLFYRKTNPRQPSLEATTPSESQPQRSDYSRDQADQKPRSTNTRTGNTTESVKKAPQDSSKTDTSPLDAGIGAYKRQLYEAAITAFEDVSPETLHDTLKRTRKLFLLDSYLHANQTSKATSIIQEDIEDGFFYFLKARLLHLKGNYDQATEHLQKAQTTPTRYGDFRKEAILLWARNYDAIYNKKANLENKKKALRAWSLASRILCTQDEHPACREALQRIEKLEQ